VQVSGSTARVLLGRKPVIRRDTEHQDFEPEEELVGLLIEPDPGETNTATRRDVRVRRLTAPPDDWEQSMDPRIVNLGGQTGQGGE